MKDEPADTVTYLTGEAESINTNRLQAAPPDNSRKKNIPDNNFYSWDQWYRLYKTAAGLENSALAENTDGTSLFDFVDKEPLKQAYRDNVCPMKQGRHFASEFDARAFGK